MLETLSIFGKVLTTIDTEQIISNTNSKVVFLKKFLKLFLDILKIIF